MYLPRSFSNSARALFVSLSPVAFAAFVVAPSSVLATNAEVGFGAIDGLFVTSAPTALVVVALVLAALVVVALALAALVVVALALAALVVVALALAALVVVASAPAALVAFVLPPGLVADTDEVAVDTNTKNELTLSIQNYRMSINLPRFAQGFRLMRLIGDVEGLGLGLGLGGITCTTMAVVSRTRSKAVNATEHNCW